MKTLIFASFFFSSLFACNPGLLRCMNGDEIEFERKEIFDHKTGKWKCTLLFETEGVKTIKNAQEYCNTKGGGINLAKSKNLTFPLTYQNKSSSGADFLPCPGGKVVCADGTSDRFGSNPQGDDHQCYPVFNNVIERFANCNRNGEGVDLEKSTNLGFDPGEVFGRFYNSSEEGRKEWDPVLIAYGECTRGKAC